MAEMRSGVLFILFVYIMQIFFELCILQSRSIVDKTIHMCTVDSIFDADLCKIHVRLPGLSRFSAQILQLIFSVLLKFRIELAPSR